MGLSPIIKKDDFESIRRAIQRLNVKLGPAANVYHNELYATGKITAYDGRDVIRYALMMGLVSK